MQIQEYTHTHTDIHTHAHTPHTLDAHIRQTHHTQTYTHREMHTAHTDTHTYTVCVFVAVFRLRGEIKNPPGLNRQNKIRKHM